MRLRTQFAEFVADCDGFAGGTISCPITAIFPILLPLQPTYFQIESEHFDTNIKTKKRTNQWQKSTTRARRTSPISRARRSPCSAMAARAMPTRSACRTAASTCASASIPAARAGPRPKRTACACCRPPKRLPRPTSSCSPCPTRSRPRCTSEDVAPTLKDGDTLMFAHGFNIRFGFIQPPPTWT